MLVAVCLGSFAWSVPAGAQAIDDDPAAPAAAAPEEKPSIAEQVRADVDETTLRWVGTPRARFSTPMQLSFGVGALAARLPSNHDCHAFCEYQGLVFAAEPGLSGAQVGVGWAHLIARRPGGSPFLSTVYIGWGARAVLLRTWGDSGLDPEAQTLAGIEGQFTVTRVNFTLGLLRRVSAAHDDADEYLVTAGIGWGF